MAFLQDPPQEPDPFQADRLLRSYLRRHTPRSVDDVARFGARVASEVRPLADGCEAHPPRLVRYDPWGHRVDRIDTHRAWQRLGSIAAEEGLIALAYEHGAGPTARIHQAAKLYLFGANSAIYGCYLAMTDGAARVLELLGDDALRQAAFTSLTSRDPDRYWTSGQWMTETSGGSDVGGTETMAEPVAPASSGQEAPDPRWLLHGRKFFTSATTSQMALTLARTEGAAGSRGLSLFYVETRRADGSWNGITVERLKDKLGTRALPTAELLLDGTHAILLGEQGRGVAHIATMLNITRLHNGLNAASYMARIVAVARDYAHRREAFGRPIADHPLHAETLADMEAEWAGATILALRLAQLMGEDERGDATDDERAVLRVLTPVVKLYTAKQAVAVVSEGLECIGGNGYMEDTGLPRLLRDAQVLPIWEGTTNVLALDMLRAASKKGTLTATLDDARRLAAAGGIRSGAIDALAADGTNLEEAGARRFAFRLARTYGGALLAEHAAWCRAEDEDADWHAGVAARWSQLGPSPMSSGSGEAAVTVPS